MIAGSLENKLVEDAMVQHREMLMDRNTPSNSTWRHMGKEEEDETFTDYSVLFLLVIL